MKLKQFLIAVALVVLGSTTVFAAWGGGFGVPTGNDGSVQYNDSNAFGGDNYLYWDKNTRRLGIGNNSPTATLEVTGTLKASDLATLASLTVTGNTTAEGLWLNTLTAGRVPYIGTGGLLSDDNGFEYNDVTSVFDVHEITTTDITDTALTATRVMIVGTGGKLDDDAGMTYATATDTLNVQGSIEANNIGWTGALTDGTISIDSATVTGTWVDLGTVTTIDIDGGTIDDTTIGAITPSTGVFTSLTATSFVGPLLTTAEANTLYLQVDGGNDMVADLTIDDGSGSSPLLYFINGSDEYLALTMADTGEGIIANDTGAIELKPSGDLGDYFSLSTSGGDGLLKMVADDSGDLTIQAEGGEISFIGDIDTDGAIAAAGTITAPTFVGGLLTTAEANSFYLQITNNLSDLSDPGIARTNLGLGNMSIQAANNVDINGGAIDGADIGADNAAFTLRVGEDATFEADVYVDGTIYGDGSNLTGVGGSGFVTFAGTNTFTGSNTFSAGATIEGYSEAVITKTGTYAVTVIDDTVIADTTSNTITLTLPTAVGHDGKVYTFKRIGDAITDLNNVVIDPAGSETVDRETTWNLTSTDEAITIISDGSNWAIKNQYGVSYYESLATQVTEDEDVVESSYGDITVAENGTYYIKCSVGGEIAAGGQIAAYIRTGSSTYAGATAHTKSFVNTAANLAGQAITSDFVYLNVGDTIHLGASILGGAGNEILYGDSSGGTPTGVTSILAIKLY